MKMKDSLGSRLCSRKNIKKDARCSTHGSLVVTSRDEDHRKKSSILGSKLKRRPHFTDLLHNFSVVRHRVISNNIHVC